MILQRYVQQFLLVFECMILCALIVPPLFSSAPFILPPKPAGLYDQLSFYIMVAFAAVYEELLYRVYIPNRLHTLHELCVQRFRASHFPFISHLKDGRLTLFVTESPAILLFAAAHRYLGITSVCFAACAGAVFRFGYLRLKRRLPPYAGITIIIVFHSIWNVFVYAYLWQSA